MPLDMTKGRPFPLLIRFALPLMLSAVLQMLYATCDSVIVGRLLGEEAFAAVGAAASLHAFPLNMLLGCSQGFGIALAQRFGAKDGSGLRRFFACSVLLLLGISLFFAALSTSLLRPLLLVMDTPPALTGRCAAYLTALWLGLPATALLNALTSALLSVGDSKTPFYSLLLSSLMNIALDFLLIAVLRADVTGAALATVLSQLAASVLCLRAAGKAGVLPGAREWRPQSTSVKELLRLGLPLLLSSGVTATGGGLFQTAVNRCGVSFVAGVTASRRYYDLLNVVGYGVEGAAGAFAGQNSGAKDYRRVARGARTVILVCVVSSLTIAAVVALFAEPLTRLYLPDAGAEALRVGTDALRVEAAFMLSLYLLCSCRAMIQGMGNTLIPMLSGFLELILRLAAVLLLPRLLGRSGLYFTDAAAWLFTAAFLVVSCRAILRLRENS